MALIFLMVTMAAALPALLQDSPISLLPRLASLADVASLEKRQAPSSQEIYPNFIVPVQAAQPDTALGTQYIGNIFNGQNLDVGFYPSGAGTTCDLFFHLPGTPSNPGNGVSSYSLGGQQAFSVQQLVSPVSSGTTYNNRPARFGSVVNFGLTQGKTTYLTTVSCQKNVAIAFEFAAIAQSSVRWFETSAAPAVGLVLVQH